MKILGTGLSGLVGSRVIELLSPGYDFENLSLETGVDITRQETVDKYTDNSEAPWVFHFAGATDVDGCEKERLLGDKSLTWRINVLATEYLVEACRRNHKKLLYISTDFVFDGSKDRYTEEDRPHPLSWYAITKYEGEKRVATLGVGGLIVRITAPYRAENPSKPDFVHRIISRLKDGQPVTSPSDQIFVPTLIDDITLALKKLTEINATGVYHVVGSQALSPYEASVKIAGAYGFDKGLVREVAFNDFYKNRAPRPFHQNTVNGKIAQLGIKMSSFDEGLNIIKKQSGKL